MILKIPKENKMCGIQQLCDIYTSMFISKCGEKK